MSGFQESVQHLQGSLARLSVKSALYPLCWLCGTISPICFFAAYAFRDYDHQLVFFLVFLGAAPIIVTLAITAGFAINSPDRLQSEDYQIRQRSLQLLQGRNRHEVIDAEAVVAIATSNPAALPAAPIDVHEGETT